MNPPSVGLYGIRFTLNVSLRLQQRRELAGLLDAVVDAGEHHVLHEDLAAPQLDVAAALREHVGERVAVVDRHQRAAERVLGRVQREREADRLLDLVDEAPQARAASPTVEIVVRRWVMPRSGSRLAASSTASRFSIGSPMPMKTAWSIGSMRRKWSAWSRISDAVRLRPNAIEPVAQNVQVSGQPGLRRDADRAPPVAEAHEHRLDGVAVLVRNSAFTVPSRDDLLLDREGREGHLLGERLAQRREGRSSARTSRRRARPSATPGARGSGLAARGEHAVEQREVHAGG